MNRRQFATASVVVASAQIQPSAFLAQTPQPTGPRSPQESAYLMMLTTWYSLAHWSTERFMDAARAMGDEWSLNAQSVDAPVEFGMWEGIYLDASSFEPPRAFVEAHQMFLNAMEKLDRASRYYVDGITLADMELVRRGSDFFNEHSAIIVDFVNQGLFEMLPVRSEAIAE